jgi:hypothetical protein
LIKLHSVEINSTGKINNKIQENNFIESTQKSNENLNKMDPLNENSNFATFKPMTTLPDTNKITQSLFLNPNEPIEKCIKTFHKSNSLMVTNTPITQKIDFKDDEELKTYLLS